MAFKKIINVEAEAIPQQLMEKNPMQNLYDAYKNNRIGYGESLEKNKEKVEKILRENGYLL